MARERIALVLAGGGARGAYEAGALSIVLPELERRGQRPTMYVGTSVGSLNAVALAAWHALPARRGGRAARRAVERGRQVAGDQADPVPERAAGDRALRGRAAVGPGPAAAEHPRPVAAAGEPRALDRLGRPARVGRRGRGRRGRRGHDLDAVRAHGRVRRGAVARGAPAAPLARDRLRARHAGRRPRERLGRDPAPLPARARGVAGGGAGLVRRRRDAPERADQARARPRCGPARGRRHGLDRRAGARTGGGRGDSTSRRTSPPASGTCSRACSSTR